MHQETFKSFVFGVERNPFSLNWPSGVIRMGFPVSKWASCKIWEQMRLNRFQKSPVWRSKVPKKALKLKVLKPLCLMVLSTIWHPGGRELLFLLQIRGLNVFRSHIPSCPPHHMHNSYDYIPYHLLRPSHIHTLSHLIHIGTSIEDKKTTLTK